MRGKLFALLLLLALPAAGGCGGKEVVVGGQKEVDAHATGDGTGGGAPSLAPGPRQSLQLVGAQGTITFDARVELVSSAGSTELLGDPGAATVRIDGQDTTLLVNGRVEEDRYTAVRVTFTSVEANVIGGLGGITGTVAVDLGVDGVTVVRPVDLGSSSEDAEILIDLDASEWLPNASGGLVAEMMFRDAVKIRRLD
ncbi:MAG TPA: hypothetical protein VFX98_17370 [Longimicrobiaceae bacterium]|nr:hypothetical protein [Longimicrobiaceae bacterium]